MTDETPPYLVQFQAEQPEEKDDIDSAKKKLDEKDEKTNAMAAALSEYLFVLLPLIVLTFVLMAKGRPELLSSPEWSFAASVLMGQSVIKYVSAIIKSKNVISQLALFVVSFVIVLGLVPSLVVLALILSADKPSPVLTGAQLSLFALSTVIFLTLGSFSASIKD